VELVRTHYADFGPTLATEFLAERHGIRLGRETLRRWMTAEGIWLSRKQRRSFHQPRLRREHYGELIQIDGSEHRWFEDRGEPCTLLVFIDDATSRLMQLRFVRSESTDFNSSDIGQDQPDESGEGRDCQCRYRRVACTYRCRSHWDGDSTSGSGVPFQSIGGDEMQLVLIGLIGLGSAVVVGLVAGVVFKFNEHPTPSNSVPAAPSARGGGGSAYGVGRWRPSPMAADRIRDKF
jgi:hypothetical protein